MMDGKMDQDVREAAAFHYLEMLPFATSRGARLIRDGQADSLPFVQTFARMKEAGRQAGLKEAAEVARDGFRCRTCGARFLGKDGHDCESPNWDGLYNNDEIADAITALIKGEGE